MEQRIDEHVTWTGKDIQTWRMLSMTYIYVIFQYLSRHNEENFMLVGNVSVKVSHHQFHLQKTKQQRLTGEFQIILFVLFCLRLDSFLI